MMQLFGQIYLDEDELLIGHLSLSKPAHFHLFSFGKNHPSNFQQLYSFIQNLIKDQKHEYLYFASRFFEMPILVLDQSRAKQSDEALLHLFNLRRALLTSLDSPFNIMKKYPGLWTKAETQMLSMWQHNPNFLDIRTLDGRIDHGELTRVERYWLEMGLPINNPTQSRITQLKQRLLNLASLFETPRFQESWQIHQLLLKKYQNEVTKDPHEKWAGMMTIMPTTTDAETIEAILYRDHHIKDRPSVQFQLPKLKTNWGKKLLTFYRRYQGINTAQVGSLKHVHQDLQDYKPPLIQNPDGTYFVLQPSENGLHGITVNPNLYAESKNWKNAADFAKTSYNQTIYKIEAPMLFQKTLVKMGVFDQHAETIVKQMIASVDQNSLKTKESLANYRLLHALKGAGETSFDNHLKQPNNILAMYLTVQLQIIELLEKLQEKGVNVYSVNSLILYVSLPQGMTEANLSELLQDNNFKITDSGHDFYAKSANNHLYFSNQNGVQAAGDGVNHFNGPNVYTDQQRPTIVETVLAELMLSAHGDLQSITDQIIFNQLQQHLSTFNPIEWMQPILSSPLKEIFAIDLKNKRLAEPAMRGFYVKSGTKNGTEVERIYYSNRGNGDERLRELAEEINLRERYQANKKNVYLEKNFFYQNRIFLIVDNLKDVAEDDIKGKLDLNSYVALVRQLLNTWKNKD